MKVGSRVLGMLVMAVLLILWVTTHPAYLSNVSYLGGLLLLELVLASVWHYEKWFCAILMLVFLWAGSDLPLSNVASATRWLFLIVGGLVGVIKWGGRREKQRISTIHLVAALCVLSALVSGVVSTKTQMSLLKSSSLFLLFLYVSFGMRTSVSNNAGKFFEGLVTACEALSFISGVAYLVLGFALFGNPNSLGAIMGVAVIPVLLWGFLISDDRQVRHRRMLALCVAGYLLASSVSRAGLLACGVTLVVMCLALRRGTLLLKGSLALAFLITIVGVVQPSRLDSLISSLTEQVIYKGQADQGLLGSRQTPWQTTVAVIKESPWFGSGFGTDSVPGVVVEDSAFRTFGGATREHGSSYMALLQYVGLLGAIPFAILLMLVLSQIYRTWAWMRSTGDPKNFAVPLAMVCLAGLLHAVFEDWLFAVGYYLSLFFWTCAFLLSDFLPRRKEETAFVATAMYTPAQREAPTAVFAGK